MKSATEYQKLIRVLSQQREEDVLQHFATKGYEVLSWGDGDRQTRSVFGMPAGMKAADLVVKVSTNRAVIAEIKGNDLDKAIAQLHSTLPFVQQRFQSVACKVFTSNPVPVGDEVGFPGTNFSLFGYRAVRVFKAQFPGEWLVMRLSKDGRSEPLYLGSEPVALVFGPYRQPERAS